MPVGVLEVIVWTCVGLFVGVVLLGFAALGVASLIAVAVTERGRLFSSA